MRAWILLVGAITLVPAAWADVTFGIPVDAVQREIDVVPGATADVVNGALRTVDHAFYHEYAVAGNTAGAVAADAGDVAASAETNAPVVTNWARASVGDVGGATAGAGAVAAGEVLAYQYEFVDATDTFYFTSQADVKPVGSLPPADLVAIGRYVSTAGAAAGALAGDTAVYAVKPVTLAAPHIAPVTAAVTPVINVATRDIGASPSGAAIAPVMVAVGAATDVVGRVGPITSDQSGVVNTATGRVEVIGDAFLNATGPPIVTAVNQKIKETGDAEGPTLAVVTGTVDSAVGLEKAALTAVCNTSPGAIVGDSGCKATSLAGTTVSAATDAATGAAGSAMGVAATACGTATSAARSTARTLGLDAVTPPNACPLLAGGG